MLKFSIILPTIFVYSKNKMNKTNKVSQKSAYVQPRTTQLIFYSFRKSQSIWKLRFRVRNSQILWELLFRKNQMSDNCDWWRNSGNCESGNCVSRYSEYLAIAKWPSQKPDIAISISRGSGNYDKSYVPGFRQLNLVPIEWFHFFYTTYWTMACQRTCSISSSLSCLPSYSRASILANI